MQRTQPAQSESHQAETLPLLGLLQDTIKALTFQRYFADAGLANAHRSASADGGVAYSRSASSSLAPGSNAGAGAYENSAVINARMHSPNGKQGNRDSRAAPGGKSSRA